MKFGKIVPWQRVLLSWQVESRMDPRPNSDVWGKLPGEGENVCWFECVIEESDRSRLYVIGSSDWKNLFGSYRAEKIATALDGPDEHQHKERIKGIAGAIKGGKKFEPSAFVSSSLDGPFVASTGIIGLLPRFMQPHWLERELTLV